MGTSEVQGRKGVLVTFVRVHGPQAIRHRADPLAARGIGAHILPIPARIRRHTGLDRRRVARFLLRLLDRAAKCRGWRGGRIPLKPKARVLPLRTCVISFADKPMAMVWNQCVISEVAPASATTSHKRSKAITNVPVAVAQEHSVFTPLYSFRSGTDGATPVAGLIRDNAGNLYSTAAVGGAYGKGTVFMVTP